MAKTNREVAQEAQAEAVKAALAGDIKLAATLQAIASASKEQADQEDNEQK